MPHVNTRAAGVKHIGFGPLKKENQDEVRPPQPPPSRSRSLRPTRPRAAAARAAAAAAAAAAAHRT